MPNLNLRERLTNLAETSGGLKNLVMHMPSRLRAARMAGLSFDRVDSSHADYLMRQLKQFEDATRQGNKLPVVSHYAFMEALVYNTIDGMGGYMPNAQLYEPSEAITMRLPKELSQAWTSSSFVPEAFMKSEAVRNYLSGN